VAQTLLVWIPETPHEIEAAARSGTLEETQSFDAKAELPAPIRNRILAEDVAAMALARRWRRTAPLVRSVNLAVWRPGAPSE
jgi:hypothetical protein